MRLALLRHGPTVWNLAGRVQGHIDIPLSQEGIAKMASLAVPPEILGGKQPVRVYVSPLRRARQTAELLGFANAQLDARLMEQNWGSWEGLTRSEILTRYGANAFIDAGAQRGTAFRPPGGESTLELHARVGAFLKEVSAHDSDALGVTHLGVLRAAYSLATDWDMKTAMPADLDIAKILLLSLGKNGSARIEALNLEFSARKA